MIDYEIPVFTATTPRKSAMQHWIEHPIDIARWLPLSVMQRTHPHLLPKKKNEGRRGRVVTVKGKRYKTLSAAAKAQGCSRSALQYRLAQK